MRQQATTRATKKRRTERKREDEAFLDWIETLPSCLTGEFSEYLDDTGEGRSIACHVRRSAQAGTGYKPKFSAVPMTFAQHAVQSHQGEAACLTRYLGGTWNRETAADWFDRQAEHYRKMWEEQNA